jgi:hypothetical protein
MRIDSNPQQGANGQGGLDRAFIYSLIAAATRQYKKMNESQTSANVNRDLFEELQALRGRSDGCTSLVRDVIDDSLKQLVKITPDVDEALSNRAWPKDILEKVYRRGYALWETKSKLSKHQHAFNRVNSFIAGGKARRLDQDLMRKVGDFAVKKTIEKIAPTANTSQVLKNAKAIMGWLRK